MSGPDADWTYNYFNYFTEVEEHFRKARGTGMFYMGTLDWALVESWKNAGVPLEAVLRGIDAAFEKWRSRKSRIRLINSVAYCTQTVLLEAQAMAGVASPAARPPAAPPFSIEELRAFLSADIADLRKRAEPAFDDIAAAVEKLLEEVEVHYRDLEQLEQRLTALEEKMIAIVRARQCEEDLFQARRDLDRELRPYRSKMTAEQLAMLEKQYLERQLLEKSSLPRLSLFYLR